MRYLYLVVVLFFAASCASNRIQYTHSKKRPTVLTEERSEKTKAGLSVQDVATVSPVDEKVSYPEEKPSIGHDKTSDSETEAHQSISHKAPTTPEEEIEGENNEQKVREAETAERLAVHSKRSFIASLILMVIPFTSIFFIIPFVIGVIQLALSNRYRYITPYGADQARIATILRNIILGILLAAILIVALLLFIFW